MPWHGGWPTCSLVSSHHAHVVPALLYFLNSPVDKMCSNVKFLIRFSPQMLKHEPVLILLELNIFSVMNIYDHIDLIIDCFPSWWTEINEIYSSLWTSNKYRQQQPTIRCTVSFQREVSKENKATPFMSVVSVSFSELPTNKYTGWLATGLLSGPTTLTYEQVRK